MRRAALVLAVLLACACSHVQHAAQTSTAQAAPSPGATASPNATPTPAFQDVGGIAAAPYIDQLTQLQIFWPPGGLFEPNKPVLRREFVRWLMHADAAIWAQDPTKVLQATPNDPKAYFHDVPASDPDFGAIEGMHDAGIPIGFPDKTFRPNLPITREEALAIKAYVDCGPPDPMLSDDTAQAYYELPHWRDARKISRSYVIAIASCLLQDQGATGDDQLETISRTFGAISALEPQQPLTRAEAAAMMWKIGQRNPDLTNFPPRSAADALQQ